MCPTTNNPHNSTFQSFFICFFLHIQFTLFQTKSLQSQTKSLQSPGTYLNVPGVPVKKLLRNSKLVEEQLDVRISGVT